MMRAFAFAVLAGLVGSAFAIEPRRDDFAYQAPIELSEPGSIYRAPLTAHVYQGVTRGDLGDLRVYNAADEAVAHGLTRPSIEPGKRLIELPIFVVPFTARGKPDDVSLFVATGHGGSIVALKTGTSIKGERSAYVVDASQSEDPLTALEVSWDEAIPDDQFIGALIVESSDDLKTWRQIGQGTVASLRRDNHMLERKRVEVSAQRVKYLRLTWADLNSSVPITAVKAELRPKADLARDWLRLSTTADKGSGEYRFDLDGRMPVDRVRIPLAMNSVARVDVLSRTKSGDPWIARGRKTIFAIQSGEREIRENEIPLSGGAGDRQWLMRLDGGGNGLGLSAPTLELGWIPHELVFVARGPTPYTIAYGNVRVAWNGDQGVDELVRRSQVAGPERIEIQRAMLGEPNTLRGQRARGDVWYAEWRKWALWSVLVLGVGLLAVTAVRVSRRIDTGR